MASVNGLMRMQFLDGSRQITFTNAISSSQALDFVDENRLVVATRAVSDNLVLLDLEKRPQQTPQLLEGLEGQTAQHVTVSADQTLIAASTISGTVVLWDVQTQKRLRVLDGLSGTISALAFSSDNTYLIASSTSSRGNTIRSHIGVWRVERGNLLHSLQAHDAPVLDLAMQPQGNILASLSAEQVQLWNVVTGQSLNSIVPDDDEDAQWRCMAFSPDGTMLVLGDTDGSITFWNASDSASGPLHRVAVRGSALTMAFSPDGRRLAVSLSEGGVGLLGIREADPR
jgi:WD40 repeat protein